MNAIDTKPTRRFALGGGRQLPFAAISAMIALSAPSIATAQTTRQTTFPSAQAATNALYVAIKTNNDTALTAILGAPKGQVCSDDPMTDKHERTQFVQKYREMRRLVREADDATVLYIGAENWPFPFPLVKSKRAWHFDSAAGLREIVFRRIGEDEAMAIQACRDLAKQTGATTAVQQNEPVLESGYVFRRIAPANQTAGTTVPSSLEAMFIAYPEKYRSTGVMTFVVRRDGSVFEKDLGVSGTARAATLTRVRPDSTWFRETH